MEEKKLKRMKQWEKKYEKQNRKEMTKMEQKIKNV